MSDFRELQPRHAILVSISDNPQPFPLQGLRVSNETAGWLGVKVRNMNGNPNDTPSTDVTFRIAPASVDYLPGQFSTVFQTGTDAALTIHGYADRLAK